jgi:hypothetical protein
MSERLLDNSNFLTVVWDTITDGFTPQQSLQVGFQIRKDEATPVFQKMHYDDIYGKIRQFR